MVAVPSAPCDVLLLGHSRALSLLCTAEKATLADDLRHLRKHHFIPALVATGLACFRIKAFTSDTSISLACADLFLGVFNFASKLSFARARGKGR